MTNAIGAYATSALLKARTGIGDTVDDTVLAAICDQVNAYIESPAACGRVMAPVPAFTTTTNGSILAGATSFVLTSVTGLNLGDALMLGATSGTHEHVIVAGIATLTVTPQAPVVNGYNTGATAQRCYVMDGDGTGCLRFRDGIRGVTLLEVAPSTRGGYTVVPATDYFLRPLPQDRQGPGWPATRLELSDYPTSGYDEFPEGYETVRALASTGWAVIPDEITDVALTAATRAWHAVQSGQADVVGTDDMGKPLVSRFFSARDYATLRTYSVNLPG
jgi:hypothetical protein